MSLVYFKTDTSGAVGFACDVDDKIDISRLGRQFRLDPTSILLNGIVFPETELELSYTWQKIEKVFRDRAKPVGMEDDPIVVSGEAAVPAVSAGDISSDDIPVPDLSLDFPGDVVLPGDRKDVVLQVERTDMYTVGQGIESSTDVVRDRKRAYRRGKEISMRTYLNKVLQILFIVFGLLTIILSVVLDNLYNDQPWPFIPFGVLAPFTIFFGFLALGWFPRIPLRFIAFLKRHGFLRHVIPCSPWHDNVLTDFSGMICTLKPMELVEGTSQLPQGLQNFLYGDMECPQGAVVTQSALEPQSSVFQDVPTSTSQRHRVQIFRRYLLRRQSLDFQEAQSIQKPEDISETLPPI